MRIAAHNILLLAALLALAACGGSGGSSSSVAGGGIGGTGTGTITGFGSVIINETRVFEVDAATEILLDGTPISEADLRAEGLGMFVRVDVGTDVSSDFTSGTALSIRAEHLVKGPVTALNPLRVLGQAVVVTGDTELPNGLVPGDLKVGDIVKVSGYASADNTIQATRLEFKPPPGIAEWKLVGPVSGLTADAFMIGGQQVNFGGITPSECGAGLGNGDLVKVEAAADAGFNSGDPLTTVTGVECISGELEIPEGAEGELEAQVEGLVTAVALPEFAVGGQRVVITATTVFEGGRAEDIVLGAKVEAQGKLDTATGVLTAEKIRFRDNRIRMIAPLTGISTTTVTVLGLQIMTTPLTEDDDDVLVLQLIQLTGIQVEVRGFEDGAGQLIATEIKDKGAQVLNDVRLRGRVEAIPAPAELTVLGITVNTAGMTFRDDDGVELTPADFFALIAVGSEVDVRGGAFDGGSTISNGTATEIRIED